MTTEKIEKSIKKMGFTFNHQVNKSNELEKMLSYYKDSTYKEFDGDCFYDLMSSSELNSCDCCNEIDLSCQLHWVNGEPLDDKEEQYKVVSEMYNVEALCDTCLDALSKSKDIAKDYFGDKSIFFKDMDLADVKGVSYNLNKVAPNLYLASNNISSGSFYKFFTLREIRNLKINLIGNDNMSVEFSKTYKNAEEAKDSLKTLEKFFSLYLEYGLIYSTVTQGNKIQTTLDMSDNKLLSNLVWAVMSSLYKFKD